ncbi:MAG: type II toxin-antitoxin system RelE/ParE family toxin [Chloroflexi bacterium]|nr:type II toxin-antitoxin system RelE/ParE family toxin [Chloroflexota bacterium]
MIVSFKNDGTEDIYNGQNTNSARRVLPRDLWRIAARKLDLLDAAHALSDLRIPPANRLEALKGDRQGQYSIRINQQYRVSFVWTNLGPDQVEITDYH